MEFRKPDSWRKRISKQSRKGRSKKVSKKVRHESGSTSELEELDSPEFSETNRTAQQPWSLDPSLEVNTDKGK